MTIQRSSSFGRTKMAPDSCKYCGSEDIDYKYKGMGWISRAALMIFCPIPGVGKIKNIALWVAGVNMTGVGSSVTVRCKTCKGVQKIDVTEKRIKDTISKLNIPKIGEKKNKELLDTCASFVAIGESIGKSKNNEAVEILTEIYKDREIIEKVLSEKRIKAKDLESFKIECCSKIATKTPEEKNFILRHMVISIDCEDEEEVQKHINDMKEILGEETKQLEGSLI